MSRWMPVVIYAGILFYLSSLHKPPVPHFWFADKVIHPGFYAGFGLLFVRAFEPTHKGWRALQILLIACIGSLVYGLTDEFHQIFVAGRSADLLDSGADAIGGFIGGIVYLLIAHAKSFIRKRKIQGDGTALAPF